MDAKRVAETVIDDLGGHHNKTVAYENIEPIVA